MAHVRSTARYARGAASSGSGREGHESRGSEERIEYAHQSDAGSRNKVGDIVDKGAHSWSFFGPLIVTISRIRGMIDSGYFAEGMGHEPRQETVPEPNPNEAVVFEEFFAASLRMPPHPVLSNSLLKFQV
jgi:hypothetical protein